MGDKGCRAGDVEVSSARKEGLKALFQALVSLYPTPMNAGSQSPPCPVRGYCTLQGLKAFLMSSPYDTPAWMPEVLMALVPGAGSRQPAAVRSEASLALSEFKRTHEADSLEALRARMGEDDWDSLQAVTSSASYFA